MSTIYSAADKGFDERLSIIDRAQIALLREVMSELGAGRLILKGGMAMRAVLGSMRLTKDIDFDRDPKLTLNAVKGRLRKSLETAASNAGIRAPKAEITKETPTTVRARLSGRSAAGSDLRFEVEVSDRQHELNRQYIRAVTVIPPASYAMAPFLVEAYTSDMLAAMKIAAAMSDMRNAPRDVYDLYDLIAMGANPVPLLVPQQAALLQQVRRDAMTKIEHIGFDLAREELLPYLPQADRDNLSEDRWMEYTLVVGEAIERWVDAALALQASAAPANGPSA